MQVQITYRVKLEDVPIRIKENLQRLNLMMEEVTNDFFEEIDQKIFEYKKSEIRLP